MDGSQIHESLVDKHLLLTNAHVATSRDDVRAKYSALDVLRIEETKVAFLESSGVASNPINVIKEWFTSPPWELDATLLELADKPPDLKVAPLAKDEVVKNERVNIMGHPFGTEMVVSLQDNRIIKQEDAKLFYRTPTEHGSSGSPVFNQRWELVALHHAGPSFSKSDANEGLLIGRVFERSGRSSLQQIRRQRDGVENRHIPGFSAESAEPERRPRGAASDRRTGSGRR